MAAQNLNMSEQKWFCTDICLYDPKTLISISVYQTQSYVVKVNVPFGCQILMRTLLYCNLSLRLLAMNFQLSMYPESSATPILFMSSIYHAHVYVLQWDVSLLHCLLMFTWQQSSFVNMLSYTSVLASQI